MPPLSRCVAAVSAAQDIFSEWLAPRKHARQRSLCNTHHSSHPTPISRTFKDDAAKEEPAATPKGNNAFDDRKGAPLPEQVQVNLDGFEGDDRAHFQELAAEVGKIGSLGGRGGEERADGNCSHGWRRERHQPLTLCFYLQLLSEDGASVLQAVTKVRKLLSKERNPPLDACVAVCSWARGRIADFVLFFGGGFSFFFCWREE